MIGAQSDNSWQCNEPAGPADARTWEYLSLLLPLAGALPLTCCTAEMLLSTRGATSTSRSICTCSGQIRRTHQWVNMEIRNTPFSCQGL